MNAARRIAPRLAGARFWPAAALALVLAALALVGSQQAAASGHPLITGITTVGDFSPPALENGRAVGARLVRVPIAWAAIAPSEEPNGWRPDDPADPSYDWAVLDMAIARTLEAGLTPMAMIYKAPRWAQRCKPPAFAPESACAPDPVAFAAFAKAAARRYSGLFAGLPRVRYWQGLIEPNLSLFFNPQFRNGKPASPALYRKLINTFYDAVKSVRPSNLVLAAGLGPIAVPRWTIGPMRFARELLCMKGRARPRPSPGGCGGGVHFDIFAVHPYTTGGPTHKANVDDAVIGDLLKLRELIDAADRAGRIKGRFRQTPLWITEFSWDSSPPDPGGVPMRILTRWMAEALYRAWDAGVSRVFWLSLRDNAPDPRYPYSETIEAGLYFRGTTLAEDQPKEIFYAFRFPFVAFPQVRGLVFWGRTPTSTPGSVVIEAKEGGGWRRMSTARADAHGIFTGVIETGYGRNRRGYLRARYRGETAIPFSMQPVKDFYQPPFG